MGGFDSVPDWILFKKILEKKSFLPILGFFLPLGQMYLQNPFFGKE